MSAPTLHRSRFRQFHRDTEHRDGATITPPVEKNRSTKWERPGCDPECHFCCGPETD